MSKEEIKMSVVFGSLLLGLLFSIFGIISLVEYLKISEKCIYLEDTIEQQTMLIEYLRGENEQSNSISS